MDNLVAWCIVPFDAEERSPEQRALMLDELGFKKMAWDWRMEHAHHQIDDFPRLLEIMMPYLYTVNLNGMLREGPKITDIGGGDQEADMIAALQASEFNGTVGILGHTEGEDIKKVLERNLQGLWHITGSQ